MGSTIYELRIDATAIIIGSGLHRSGLHPELEVYYVPFISEVEALQTLRDRFVLVQDEQPDLWRRLETLYELLQASLPKESLHFQTEVFSYQGRITKLRLMDDNIQVQLDVQVKNIINTVPITLDSMTTEKAQLVESCKGSIRRLAWEHLKQSLDPTSKRVKDRVFISYRKGHEKLAEAVAHRLGQEGLKPWFDAWDIAAGDSLVGKIEEAFDTSFTFVPILSTDYVAGKWASTELETALVKRINSNFRIVPVLYDPGTAIPALIEGTVWVDCTNHSPDAFEGQMRLLLDGIFGLTRNPYV